MTTSKHVAQICQHQLSFSLHVRKFRPVSRPATRPYQAKVAEPVSHRVIGDFVPTMPRRSERRCFVERYLFVTNSLPGRRTQWTERATNDATSKYKPYTSRCRRFAQYSLIYRWRQPLPTDGQTDDTVGGRVA